jgi:hypothetical protein
MRAITVVMPLCAGLALLGNASTAPAARDCSNSTLHGSYGLHATGDIIDVGKFAAVGVFSFDGEGHLRGTLTSRVNSNNSFRESLTGEYSVSPDCFVSDTWNFTSGETSQHESVIVDRGRGYVILNTTEGAPVVISGEARKQFPGHNESD